MLKLYKKYQDSIPALHRVFYKNVYTFFLCLHIFLLSLIKLMIFFHHRRFLQEKEVIIEYSLIYLLFSIEKQILKKFDFHTWVYLKFRISHSFTIFDPFISLDRHKLEKKE